MDPLRARLLDAAEKKRDRLIDVISELVRVPSVVGDEADASRWIADAAGRLDVDLDVFDVDHDAIRAHRAYVPMPDGTSYEGRPNVVATRRGTGGGRPLYLFGHVDTVPVDPNTTWEHGPFGGEVVDGRIYGRGAADMKAGCAVALVALELLEELGVELAGDVAAQFVIEEEAGGNGTLGAVLHGSFDPSGACIMLEPTTPREIMVSNRGAQYFRVTVPGEEGGTEYHRSLANAIDKAYVVIQAVNAYSDLLEARADAPLYEAYGSTRVPLAVCRMQAGAWPSTVPGEAVLEGTIECLPGEDIHEVVRDFERYLRKATERDPFLREHPIRFEPFGLFFDASAIDPEGPFVRTLAAATEEITGEAPTVLGGGGSDLRLPVLYANCPTVLFGPGGGPIHSVDEWVEIQQVVDLLKICVLTAVDWCGVPA